MPTLVEFERTVATIVPSDPGDAQQVQRVREATRIALADSDFVMDCIDRALSGFEQDPGRRPQPPLFVAAEHRFAAHLVYWPAEHRNNPHLHATWGVTGVFHNQVVVETFTNAGGQDEPQLEPATRFEAQRGEVGYLLPSCIHCVGNESDRPSATLHLFGADDLNRPAECTTVWFGGRSEEGMSAGLLPRAMETFTEILMETGGPTAEALLERVFALSPKKLKLRIVQGLARHNLALSHRLSVALEQELDGADRARLAAINKKLATELAC
jgi:predicted metal-dependent enzyme (double-stranded beta helix superfamily)